MGKSRQGRPPSGRFAMKPPRPARKRKQKRGVMDGREKGQLTRRNSTTGSFSISSSFVKSSVGVFDVEPGFDGHVGG